MKKPLLLITGLLLLFSVEGQILRYSNHTAPTPPEEPPVENILVNGTFDNTDYWTVGEGWVITGGVATFNSAISANLQQEASDMSVPIAAATDYKLTFNITINSGPDAEIIIRDNAVTFVAQATYGAGPHTIYFTTPGSIGEGLFRIRALSTTDDNWSIDNIVLTLD